jgi:hypothetical protein
MAFAEETPIGTMDGVNNLFTLSTTPNLGTFRLYLNGQKLAQGIDFNYSGTALLMYNIPYSTDSLIAKFKY